jgi:hypothetical protein
MRIIGLPLNSNAPGFGPSWTRVESAHFVVYHQLGDLFREEEPRFFEEARDADLVKLEVSESDVARVGKLPLFLFKDQSTYQLGGGERWAGGHASSGELEDGVYHMICTFPGRRNADAATIPHELAHVIVREAYADLELAAWANEGVAMFCEPDAIRQRRRAAAARTIAAGTWKPFDEFLGRATLDASGDEAIHAFYDEAHSAFEQLVEAAGGVKAALRVASRISKKGVDAGLKEANLSADTLEAATKAKLKPQ